MTCFSSLISFEVRFDVFSSGMQIDSTTIVYLSSICILVVRGLSTVICRGLHGSVKAWEVLGTNIPYLGVPYYATLSRLHSSVQTLQIGF